MTFAIGSEVVDREGVRYTVLTNVFEINNEKYFILKKEEGWTVQALVEAFAAAPSREFCAVHAFGGVPETVCWADCRWQIIMGDKPMAADKILGHFIRDRKDAPLHEWLWEPADVGRDAS